MVAIGIVLAAVWVAALVVAGLLVRSARTDAMTAQQRADQAQRDLVEALEKHEKDLAERGKRAALGARSAFDGHVAEHAFPYAAEHSYHPKDIVHVGGVIDFIVFDGLFQVRQGTKRPDELTIVLIDVKYGSSALSREQRAVMDAMNKGRTRGECWNARENVGQLVYRPRGEVVLWRPPSAFPDARRPPLANLEDVTLDVVQFAGETDATPE